MRCELESLVQYDAWYLGFRDTASGWEGIECFRLAASEGAHARFIAGCDASERRGRIGVLLEALGVIESDDAAESYVAFATRVGTRPKKLKVMLRRCLCHGLYFLVFLLPEEQAPGADWKQAQ